MEAIKRKESPHRESVEKDEKDTEENVVDSTKGIIEEDNDLAAKGEIQAGSSASCEEDKKEDFVERNLADEKKKVPGGQKRKSSTNVGSPSNKKMKIGEKDEKVSIYPRCSKLILSESLLRELDYPRPDTSGKEGHVLLYGNHLGFRKGHCKRCDSICDTTYSTKSRCNYHLERSKRFNGRQHPHGCCGRKYGSTGCRAAPTHVHQDNLYLDLQGYRKTEKKENSEGKVYALDTESIHTKKGLEVCRVTVVDEELNVVYNNFCLPTSDIVDYNTVWSGITEQSLAGVTKTFKELREDMLKLFSADTILVGHGLSHDLTSMKIIHDKVIDTLYLYPHHRGWPLKRALKDIALTELGMRIQGDGHDSEEDAVVAMKLVLRKLKHN